MSDEETQKSHNRVNSTELEEDFGSDNSKTYERRASYQSHSKHSSEDQRDYSDEDDYEDPVITPVDSAVIQTAEAVSFTSPPTSSKELDSSEPDSFTVPPKSPNRTRFSMNSSVAEAITSSTDSEINHASQDEIDHNDGLHTSVLTKVHDEVQDHDDEPQEELSQKELSQERPSNVSLEEAIMKDATFGTAAAVSVTQHEVSPTSTTPSATIIPISPAISRRTSTESDAPPLPPRKRMPFFWLKSKSPRASFSSCGSKHPSGFASMASSEYDLVMQRLDANKERLATQKAQGGGKDAFSGIREIQKNFEDVKVHKDTDYENTTDIDWEFWTSVVSDYPLVAKEQPQELSRAIASGFPRQLRGLIWQLIAASKNAPLEEMYENILQESSPHEKAIKRDLARTSFIADANPDSLFRMIKAYSLYDPEVGYTQGMAFIAVPILLNMTESEAFCLLVCLMKDYGLRTLFLSEMPGLHLRLYQFDRIIEDTVPSLHIHLARQGVRSSMYASQWFLTLFAYKFPLQIVMRIFDIVIAEGVEAILRFGVALMCKNANTLLNLEFDALLTFLKENIFDCYLMEELGGEPAYNVNELVEDAYQVRVMPVTLRKYENEYTEIHRIERERIDEVESLRSSNGVLTSQVRRLESELATLNKEHIQIANEMVQGRLEIAKLRDDNDQLNSELQELRPSPDEDDSKEGGTNSAVEAEEEMAAIRQQNLELIETKERLENQLTNLERELLDTKQELASLEDEHKALKMRWLDLGRHFNEFK